MLYSNLVGRKKKILLKVIIIALASFLFTSEIYSATISPISTEEILNVGQDRRHSITYSNDESYDIFVTPKIYKYYPQSEYVLDLEPYEEFVIIDTDYIEIPANTKKGITFIVTAPETLEPGTYYNLIVLEPTGQDDEEKPVIGASGALSHLVKLHLTDNVKGVQATDKYDTTLEVLDRGIPFIKPAKIKFTFFNNSKYSLTPKGEIQVVKRSGDQEPQYYKINSSGDKVFPEQSYEEDYEIEKWYLEDIFFGKNAYMRVQNGIDENVRSEEVKIPGFRNEFLYIIATITVVILLATSLKGDTKPEQEYAE